MPLIFNNIEPLSIDYFCCLYWDQNHVIFQMHFVLYKIKIIPSPPSLILLLESSEMQGICNFLYGNYNCCVEFMFLLYLDFAQVCLCRSLHCFNDQFYCLFNTGSQCNLLPDHLREKVRSCLALGGNLFKIFFPYLFYLKKFLLSIPLISILPVLFPHRLDYRTSQLKSQLYNSVLCLPEQWKSQRKLLEK